MTTTDQRQNSTLDAHTHRLDDLEDRLNVTFPAPDTPVGGAQRIRLAVPTPASVVTIGARGTSTMEGRPIGPGGVAIRTVESFGVEIKGSTCLDTDGRTIVHSLDSLRFLTQADLGGASQGAMCLGTDTGDLELTAGGVTAVDPEFTVVPDQDISSVTVDTSGPRSPIEEALSVWKATLKALKEGARLASESDTVPNAPSSPSIAPEWASTIGSLVSHIATARRIYDMFLAPVMAQIAPEQGDSGDPKLKLHGAGGVAVTSPSKVAVFGERGVSIDSFYKATLSGGVTAGIYSPVAAQVYGSAAAKLKSDVTATVSARHTVMKGQYAEVRGERIACLSSVDKVLVQSKGTLAIDAAEIVAIGGRDLHAYGERCVSLAADSVSVQAEEQIDSAVEDAHVVIEPRRVRLHVGGRSELEVGDDKVTIKAGTTDLTVEPGRVSVGQKFRVLDTEVVLRGSVRMG